jgi:hypothetical protein
MKNDGCSACKKTLHEDRAATMLCAWCEMPLEKSRTIAWRNNNERHMFCSKQCMTSFIAGGRV